MKGFKMTDPKKIREKLGLTQAQMAIACNTNISTIAKWEATGDAIDKRKPRGPSERLLQLLSDMESMDLMDWYRKKYMS